jgi:hypothetical protein
LRYSIAALLVTSCISISVACGTEGQDGGESSGTEEGGAPESSSSAKMDASATGNDASTQADVTSTDVTLADTSSNDASSIDAGPDDGGGDAESDASTDAGSDADTGPPVACPYAGPPLVSVGALVSCASATCSAAHCVSGDALSDATKNNLAACGGGGGFCAPDPIITSLDNDVPPTCTSMAGAEGRCISTCVPWVASRASYLPQSSCPSGTRCAPCYDPVAANPSAPTGMCSFGCDQPTQAPTLLSCPYPQGSPDVVTPSALPGCSCAGAHCAPAELVGAASVSAFNTCGNQGYCVPDDLLRSGGNVKPPNCVPFAGVSISTAGRCLSACLKTIASNPTLETSTCGAGAKCAPCFDPFTGAATGACSLSSCDAPPANVFKFPSCCSTHGRCIPKSQIPDGQEANFVQDACSSSTYLCVPNEYLPAPNNTPAQNCHATTLAYPAGYDGMCVPKCMNLDATVLLLFPQSTCSSDALCLPCDVAPGGCL